MMLARPDEVGGGGRRWRLRGGGERQLEQAETSELKTSKTLQCCHLQAETFKAYSVTIVFSDP